MSETQIFKKNRKAESQLHIPKLKYSDSKIKNYLVDEKMNPHEMKIVFRHTAQMKRFGENS